jgi:hypothetical protein
LPTDGSNDVLQVVMCSIASVLSPQLAEAAVLNCCVATVCEMEASTEYWMGALSNML